jgi:hypothetical protein
METFQEDEMGEVGGYTIDRGIGSCRAGSRSREDGAEMEIFGGISVGLIEIELYG